MRTVDEHFHHVHGYLRISLEPELVPLRNALGRVPVGTIDSPVDLPLFRNSQMDGFAVRSADIASVPVTLPIVGEVSARASAPGPLAPGTAVRIMTGAVVPEGADAVIPVEDTTVDGDQVTILTSRAENEYVRERGSDLTAGDPLPIGFPVLEPRHLAAYAAAGIAEVEVQRRARVAVITTGAELIDPGTKPALGQVFDANSVALVALVAACGAEVTVVRRVVDDTDLLEQALAEAAAQADIILTSGGISHGDYEVVRELLEPRGGWFGHVAMQPGGPQGVARFNEVPVICFPGNPVSTQVSFEVFVAPILRGFTGQPTERRRTRVLWGDLTSPPGKRQYLRGRLSTDTAVELVSGPGSHLVAGLAASDLLIVVPEDVTSLQWGDEVETIDL